MNDLLVNAELDYRVNRIREDWSPIRARRARRRQRREEEARYAVKPADGATWIG
jgi:DNA-binding protein H-NS